MEDCLDPGVLSAYVEGRLEPSLLEGAELHLAGCFLCREHAVLIARLVAPRAEASRRLWWAAAAALLLLTVAWGWARLGSGPKAPATGASASPRPAQGRSTLAGSVLETAQTPRWWSLPEGTRLALAAGSRLALGKQDAALERGSLWVEAQGTLSQIRTPLGLVRLEGAECVVRLEAGAPSPAFSLGEAWASEGAAAGEERLTVACFQGSVRVQRESAAWTVAAGSLLEAREGEPPAIRPTPAALQGALLGWLEPLRTVRSYADAQGLQDLGGEGARTASSKGVILDGRMKPARLNFPDLGAGDYTLEIVLRATERKGDLGVSFPAEGMFPYWVTPVRGLGEGISRLTVRRHGGLILFCREGREPVVCRDPQALGKGASASGLTVWGDAVEVLEIKVISWRASS